MTPRLDLAELDPSRSWEEENISAQRWCRVRRVGTIVVGGSKRRQTRELRLAWLRDCPGTRARDTHLRSATRARREARDLTSSPISSAVVLLGLESIGLGNSSKQDITSTCSKMPPKPGKSSRKTSASSSKLNTQPLRFHSPRDEPPPAKKAKTKPLMSVSNLCCLCKAGHDDICKWPACQASCI